MGATWSPDGTRIAFFDVDGMWRAASLSVVDVATGKVTKIHNSLFGPGTPTWSPDGKRVALAMVSPYSKSFREGTNQILTCCQLAGGDDKWFAPVPNLSIDSRGGCGPSGRPMARRWPPSTKANSPSGRFQTPASLSVLLAISPPTELTRLVGAAIPSTSYISPWTS